MWSSIPSVLTLLLAVSGSVATNDKDKDHRKSCVVKSGGSNATDDAPAILKAFKKCGHKGRVVFEPTNYYVNSVMNIDWLKDVDVDIYGTLLVFSPRRFDRALKQLDR
jgi:hypothetical protein